MQIHMGIRIERERERERDRERERERERERYIWACEYIFGYITWECVLFIGAI